MNAEKQVCEIIRTITSHWRKYGHMRSQTPSPRRRDARLYSTVSAYKEYLLGLSFTAAMELQLKTRLKWNETKFECNVVIVHRCNIFPVIYMMLSSSDDMDSSPGDVREESVT